MKSKLGAVQKNIYVEERSGAFRFIVQVSPFPKTAATFDACDYDAGLTWAEKKCIALREQKRTGIKCNVAAVAVVTPAPEILAADTKPERILVRDVLDYYRKNELSGLSGAKSAASRLTKLDGWFGALTVGELKKHFLSDWTTKRLAGLFGSGRGPRGEKWTKAGSKEELEPLTKHQRLAMKRRGEKLPAKEVFPVEPQSVRHELVLLRTALKTYFKDNEDISGHLGWLMSQHVMTMDLPDKSEPRTVRMSDSEIAAIYAQLDSIELRTFFQMTVLTTLRRAELCSLRWEDVNFEGQVVTLQRPGYIPKEKKGDSKKTKTTKREVPLLPAAQELLRKLGPKKSGHIFTMTPSGISQALRSAADRAGLHHVRLHDGRREGISRLIETCDLTLETIKVFSGHADIATLQRHYAQPDAKVVSKRVSAHPGIGQILPML
jgi:integrase